MKLTGKCKKDFEKWYIKKGIHNSLIGLFNKEIVLSPTAFYKLPFSMQYGVLVDFFHTIEYEDRTLGIYIINKTQILLNFWNSSNVSVASDEIITKVNKIYNERKLSR